MKFGDTLPQQSVPKWKNYNIDYATVKGFIKENTTPGRAKAVSIPGKNQKHDQLFENELFGLLKEEHDRSSLFTKSRRHEIDTRLSSIERQIDRLKCKSTPLARRAALRLRLRCSKLESDVLCLEDEIKNLSRYISSNRTAILKLVKKYHKWTGSSDLGSRIQTELLQDEDSFYNLNLEPIKKRFGELSDQALSLPQQMGLSGIKEQGFDEHSQILAQEPCSTPDSWLKSNVKMDARLDSVGHADKPGDMGLRRLSSQEKLARGCMVASPDHPSNIRPVKNTWQNSPQKAGYWNEYDSHFSDDEKDPFMIYIDPHALMFPGQQLVSRLSQKLKAMVTGVKVKDGDLEQQAGLQTCESRVLGQGRRRSEHSIYSPLLADLSCSDEEIDTHSSGHGRNPDKKPQKPRHSDSEHVNSSPIHPGSPIVTKKRSYGAVFSKDNFSPTADQTAGASGSSSPTVSGRTNWTEILQPKVSSILLLVAVFILAIVHLLLYMLRRHGATRNQPNRKQVQIGILSLGIMTSLTLAIVGIVRSMTADIPSVKDNNHSTTGERPQSIQGSWKSWAGLKAIAIVMAKVLVFIFICFGNAVVIVAIVSQSRENGAFDGWLKER